MRENNEVFDIETFDKPSGIVIKNIDSQGFSWSDNFEKLYVSLSSEHSSTRRGFLEDDIGMKRGRTIIEFSLPTLSKIERLTVVREFLLFRPLIIRYLEIDFMQDVFAKYHQQSLLLKEIKRTSSVRHGELPLLSVFSAPLKYLLDHDSEEFSSLISVYSNTLVSSCYRYYLLDQGMDLPLPLPSTYTTVSGFETTKKAIERVIAMNKWKEKGFEVKKGHGFSLLASNRFAGVTFGHSDDKDVFDLAALVYLLVENACAHGEGSCVVDFEQNDENPLRYDLVVSNERKQDDKRHMGITHMSLEYLFEKNIKSRGGDGKGYCKLIPEDDDPRKYKCTISNVMRREP